MLKGPPRGSGGPARASAHAARARAAAAGGGDAFVHRLLAEYAAALAVARRA